MVQAPLQGVGVHQSAELGAVVQLSALLDQGANPQGTFDHAPQVSPLHLAAAGGHTDAARILLEGGGRIYAVTPNTERTPLHAAAMANNAALVRLLVEAGADVNARDLSGYTPLALATFMGCSLAVRALIGLAADTNIASEDGGWTPAHLAARLVRDEALEILTSCGTVDLNARDQWNRTPLHWAAFRGTMDNAQLLVQCRADVSLLDADGLCPAQIARACGHVSVADYLAGLPARQVQDAPLPIPSANVDESATYDLASVRRQSYLEVEVEDAPTHKQAAQFLGTSVSGIVDASSVYDLASVRRDSALPPVVDDASSVYDLASVRRDSALPPVVEDASSVYDLASVRRDSALPPVVEDASSVYDLASVRRDSALPPVVEDASSVYDLASVRRDSALPPVVDDSSSVYDLASVRRDSALPSIEVEGVSMYDLASVRRDTALDIAPLGTIAETVLPAFSPVPDDQFNLALHDMSERKHPRGPPLSSSARANIPTFLSGDSQYREGRSKFGREASVAEPQYDEPPREVPPVITVPAESLFSETTRGFLFPVATAEDGYTEARTPGSLVDGSKAGHERIVMTSAWDDDDGNTTSRAVVTAAYVDASEVRAKKAERSAYARLGGLSEQATTINSGDAVSAPARKVGKLNLSPAPLTPVMSLQSRAAGPQLDIVVVPRTIPRVVGGSTRTATSSDDLPAYDEDTVATGEFTFTTVSADGSVVSPVLRGGSSRRGRTPTSSYAEPQDSVPSAYSEPVQTTADYATVQGLPRSSQRRPNTEA